MRLYKKIIPKIARDCLNSLIQDRLIEIEDGKIGEAELDLAAVMVEYLDFDEKLNEQTRDLLQRRGMSAENFLTSKKSLASSKNFKFGNDTLDYIVPQLVEALMISKNIVEVFADDFELRKRIRNVIEKYAGISEDIDKEVRQRLKNFPEGSCEWEIEYPRAVAQIKRQRGLL